MSTVFLDGTSVDFSGPAPQSPLELQQLLSQHLESQQRLLIRFEVDGKELLNTNPQEFPQAFKKVEAASASQIQVFLELIQQAHGPAQNLSKECEHYAQAVLTQPWSFMATKIGDVIGQVSPLLEVFSCLESYSNATNPEWKEALKELLKQFEQKIEELVQAAQNTDVGSVSEILAFELGPLIQKSLDFIQNKVRPYFEAELKKTETAQNAQ